MRVDAHVPLVVHMYFLLIVVERKRSSGRQQHRHRH